MIDLLERTMLSLINVSVRGHVRETDRQTDIQTDRQTVCVCVSITCGCVNFLNQNVCVLVCNEARQWQFLFNVNVCVRVCAYFLLLC